MNINTILQILYANKLDHIVSLAIQIDSNIPLTRKEGDEVMIEISRNSLPNGKTFIKGSSWGTVNVTIIGINIYSIDKPYMVILPNNKIEWIGEDKIKTGNYDTTTIIEEEVVQP